MDILTLICQISLIVLAIAQGIAGDFVMAMLSLIFARLIGMDNKI